MTPLRQRVLDELQRRNYSSATARGYILAIKQFAEYFGKSPERLGGDEVRRFAMFFVIDIQSSSQAECQKTGASLAHLAVG